ncbi:hypothetical protein, partial [Methanomethylovorans sp.]|uniref:hypothetical protein n=1 Tax=Methanomethylovorans sp. TaxID=2758717 RepID=UPI00351C3E2A
LQTLCCHMSRANNEPFYLENKTFLENKTLNLCRLGTSKGHDVWNPQNLLTGTGKLMADILAYVLHTIIPKVASVQNVLRIRETG